MSPATCSQHPFARVPSIPRAVAVVLLLTLLGPATVAARAAPSTKQGVLTILLGPGPYGAAFDPRTDHVFLDELSTDTMQMRDAKDGVLLRTIALPTAMSSLSGNMLVAGQEGRVFVGTTRPGLTAGGAVSTIDTATGRLLRSVAMGENPQVLLVDESSKRVMVRSDSQHLIQGRQEWTSTISMLDARSGTIVSSTAVPGSLDAGLADDPGRERAIVVYQLNSGQTRDMTYGLVDTRTGAFITIADLNQNGQTPLLDLQRGVAMIVDTDESTIHVVDTRSGAVLHTIAVDAFPEAGAIDPRTGLGYIVSPGSEVLDGRAVNGTFSTLDLVRGVVQRRVVVGDDVLNMGLSASGDRALVTLGSGLLAVVDTETDRVLHALPIGMPWGPAFSSDGLAYQYSDVCTGSNDADKQTTCARLNVIDAESGVLVHTFDVGYPLNPLPTEDTAQGTLLFVTSTQPGPLAVYPSGPGTVAVLKAASETLLARIPVGLGPYAIGLDTSTGRLLVLNAEGDGTAPPSTNPAEPVCSNKTLTNVANPPPCRLPYASLSIVALPS